MRALAIAVLVLAGCTPRVDPGPEPAPPTVKVLAASAVVKSGAIGVKLPQSASYVLVQAENGSPEPRLVVLQGNLVDAAGQEVASLSMDQLHVPPGESRVFALVASKVVDAGSIPKIAVRTAPVAESPPEVRVKTLETRQEEQGLVASLVVENTFDKAVLATVIVAFFDDQGTILARPFSVDNFAPQATRPLYFKGPKGATRAQAFIGDSSI
jgi:hypothetical protein